MADNNWDFIRSGRTDEGLQRMRDAYSRESTNSDAMELGVAYLWVGDFQMASDHFDDFNRKRPHHISVTYGMSGTAKWCLGKRPAAVAEWHSGLNCQFADAGGAGLRIPLLLFFASVAEPSVFPPSEADNLLHARSADPRATIWPAHWQSSWLGG